MQKRQNEDILLKIQYAARNRYNSAEVLLKISLVLCLLPVLSLIPALNKVENIVSVIVLIIDAALLGVMLLTNKCVEEAASFREYFDCYVFGYNTDDSIKSARIREKALQIYDNHIRDAYIQISNTGEDSPPGVKNWYTISRHMNDVDIIYKCQYENAWWTTKLFNWYWVNLIGYALVLVSCFVILRLGFKIEWCDLIIAFLGVTIKLFERIIHIVKFVITSLKIEGAFQILSNTRTQEQLLRLQKLIDDQRRIPFLPSNRMHQKKANLLSKLYRKINIE